MNGSFHLGNDGIYRCDAFQQFIWQSHGFGTRTGNPEPTVTLNQVHSDVVWNAHGLKNRERDGDGLITQDVGLCIGVRTADCVPVLLLDTKGRVVGAVHAGWRGTATEVVRCAIHKMARDFETEPKDILAAIGPCIRECCYEVGQEVAAQFEKAMPEWRDTPAKQGGKRNLNLARLNSRQMAAAGVPEEQIFDSCLCTCCQIADFFSYRREPGEERRMTSAISRLA